MTEAEIRKDERSRVARSILCCSDMFRDLALEAEIGSSRRLCLHEQAGALRHYAQDILPFLDEPSPEETA